MNKRNDTENQLVSGLMKDFRRENPSPGFTQGVMERIRLQDSLMKSRPLIGRAGWIGIAAGLCLLLGLIFLDAGDQAAEEAGWLSQNLPSLGIPFNEFDFADLFAWMHPEDPAMFWIFASIGGFILLAFLQRLFGARYYGQI